MLFTLHWLLLSVSSKNYSITPRFLLVVAKSDTVCSSKKTKAQRKWKRKRNNGCHFKKQNEVISCYLLQTCFLRSLCWSLYLSCKVWVNLTFFKHSCIWQRTFSRSLSLARWHGSPSLLEPFPLVTYHSECDDTKDVSVKESSRWGPSLSWYWSLNRDGPVNKWSTESNTLPTRQSSTAR